MTLAKGQDPGGLWGHQLVTPERNGRLPGYGRMNQPSLSCFMGLVLAQECGIDDPEVTQAIERTYAYCVAFIGKGSFNYGVHGPNTQRFNNNGTSAMCALVMAMKGNKEGAAFFSKLSAASYETLESGHALYLFNPMWTPLGVAVAGPEATSQFFKKARWVYTMYRTWDGRFTLNGDETKVNASAALVLPYPCGRRRQGRGSAPIASRERRRPWGVQHICGA